MKPSIVSHVNARSRAAHGDLATMKKRLVNSTEEVLRVVSLVGADSDAP